MSDMLTLCSVASIKASRHACADHELSFSKTLQAKNLLLYHIKQLTWPDKHINTLVEFFWHLKSTPCTT
ncbi:hypothetical protein JVT61DRAFT_7815 [Boletus reticuloceps]|uniref:Uncharacterized protein n=1 Tax=Boletus reticuloceps TaxID=495285 RepID=A0A8I2YIE4_9AGAM|nr:hypothetical protein JVT61DRAFT_7815 [Boletus reticuloceps]